MHYFLQGTFEVTALLVLPGQVRQTEFESFLMNKICKRRSP